MEGAGGAQERLGRHGRGTGERERSIAEAEHCERERERVKGGDGDGGRKKYEPKNRGYERTLPN